MESLDNLDAPVRPRPVGDRIPLTELQRDMWNAVTRSGTTLSRMRLIATAVRLSGPLDVDLLRRSIEAVVQRHESLRTVIVRSGDLPTQYINRDCKFAFDVVDLTQTAPAQIEADALRLAQQFIAAAVDITIGPLLEAKLLRLGTSEYVFLLGLDHIVCDGASNAVLCREIWTYYKDAALGQPCALPQLPVQFADYAVWQQRTYDAWLKRHGAYWRDRLAGAPRLTIPPDEKLKEDEHPVCLRVHVPLGKELTRSLRDSARRERTPLSSVVLAILAATLSRWCEQDDLVLGFVSHGRNRPELAHMIGCIATYLYIRIQINHQDSLHDLLRKINLELQAAHAHPDYGRIPSLYLKEPPGVLFNWASSQWSPVDWGRWSTRPGMQREGEIQTAPFPIELPPVDVDRSFYFQIAPSDTTGGIIFALAYRSDLLSPAKLEWLFQTIRRVSEQYAMDPSSPIASLRAAS